MVMQEKIVTLNSENARYVERHRVNKANIADQVSTMKGLDKRIRELSRQVEFMQGHLNEAQLELTNSLRGDSYSDDQRSVCASSQAGDVAGVVSVAPASAPIVSSPPQTLADFKRLPGLDLRTLL